MVITDQLLRRGFLLVTLQVPGKITFVRIILRAQVALKAGLGLTTPLDVI